MSLSDRHADAVTEPLTKRTGCRFHAGRHPAFGMAGGAAFPLAKLFDLFERNVVTGKIKHAVKQHRSVARRKDKTITVRPGRIARAMSEEACPQHIRRWRQTHVRARMSVVRLLHCVHG